MMQTKEGNQSVEYARAIATLVARMSIQRAAQVYDFARFLQSQTEEEDIVWEASLARHRDKFAALAEVARTEIPAGTAQRVFDEHGELTLECIHARLEAFEKHSEPCPLNKE